MRPLIAFAAVLLSSGALADGDQRFIDIGDLNLESGSVLHACRVGYRTFGVLNPKGDNAVLVPTWFLGKTNDLRNSFRSGGLVDPSKYFVIAVDALTNGISTSPSNYQGQFPDISIRDMVESQHQMLLKLGIQHLKAVLGISMGGMQTFQWLTAYPTFMDCAVPIVGSPRPTSYDLMLYQSSLNAVDAAISNPSARQSLIRVYADFFWMALNTPDYYVHHTRRDQATTSLTGFERSLLAWDPRNMAAGLNAMLNLDVFRPFGDDQSSAAAAVHARVLVIVASHDHCVNPAPALEFAKALKAQTIVLDDEEGHSSPGIETKRIGPAIDRFLGG